jgi:hypothetical protein
MEKIGLVKLNYGKEIMFDSNSDFLLKALLGIFKVNNVYFNFCSRYNCCLVTINGKKIPMEKGNLFAFLKKFSQQNITLNGNFLSFDKKPVFMIRKIYGEDLRFKKLSKLTRNLTNYVNGFLFKSCCKGNMKYKYLITKIVSPEIIRIKYLFGCCEEKIQCKISGCKDCLIKKFIDELEKNRIEISLRKGIYNIKNI